MAQTASSLRPSSDCPLCGGTTRRQTVRNQLSILTCHRCTHARLTQTPTDENAIYELYRDADYFDFWGGNDATHEHKLWSAEWIVDKIERHHQGARVLLEVGCAGGELLATAKSRGWTVAGVELCAPIAEQANRLLGAALVRVGPFDQSMVERLMAEHERPSVIVFNDVLEHLPDPLLALEQCYRLLPSGGCVVINAPDFGSLSSRLMRGQWTHFKAEHLTYFSKASLSQYLERAGFRVLRMDNTVKALSPSYIADHLRVYNASPLTRSMHRLVSLLPRAIADRRLPLLSGNLLAMAQKP